MNTDSKNYISINFIWTVENKTKNRLETAVFSHSMSTTKKTDNFEDEQSTI